MRTINLPCEYCNGVGCEFKYDVIERNNSIVTLETKKVPCEHCNGTGYSAHVIFSVEEAGVILKHCGLSTES